MSSKHLSVGISLKFSQTPTTYNLETRLKFISSLGYVTIAECFCFSYLFQSGVVGGIMQLLLLSMSAHMTKELGMAPGGEFRQAVKEVFLLKMSLQSTFIFFIE